MPAGSRQRHLRSDSLLLVIELQPMRSSLRVGDKSGWSFRQYRIGHLKSLRMNCARLLAGTTVHGVRISRNGRH